ncbi:DUF1963 domain-containing protein [Afifella sp. H1R]|uniref:DUF1963 domain-containing protein n=1 Tax=Afifella sp. H1R TaxID=2908841 RepID=UPI001F32F316|nr:DUF1963 domain-containing protein [Afifella sp. H1R]MCF1505548.1 DUF1963 domain-containing protein [Afifella sp. H1R]
MDRIGTGELSVDKGQFFEAVTALAGSIFFLRQPRTMFSAQMSVWTSDPSEGISPEDWLTRTLSGARPVTERRPVAFADLSGEWSRVDDRLEDPETGESRPWHRLRVLLVPPEGSAWYHATAMCDGQDLPAVESEFLRVLQSMRLKVEGESAHAARAEARAEMDDLLTRAMERSRAAVQRQTARPAGPGEKPAPPVRDVETRFDEAVQSAGLGDRREALRRIALPTLVLTEAGESNGEGLGQSRVGGGPDLAEASAWPRDRSGFHLNFLAQINLADLPHDLTADLPDDLPAAGLLSFFSGTDMSDGTVLYTQSDTALVAHDLPSDAEETASRAMNMVEWDEATDRMVATSKGEEDLVAATDVTGRLAFLRDGEPVVVLASEYEISRSRQLLRFDRALSVPFGLPGSLPEAYVEVGLEDPYDFYAAIREAFDVGDGPQHQMFGVTGVRDLPTLQDAAAKHARRASWHDLTTAQDWFLLLKIASGGEVGFDFFDHGDFIYMANRQDTRKGDFSRIHAFVVSG